MIPRTNLACDLVDLQVNGFAGVDFQRADVTAGEMIRAVEALRSHRTGRILLTLITDRVDALCAKLAHYESLREADQRIASMVAGYHLEGPYLSPEPGYHGAHPPDQMKAPDRAELDRLDASARGRIRLITLAPEWPGSVEFIREAVSRGIRVAIGHSNAESAVIDKAIVAGLTLCTHLGNGVPMTLPRHDNIIQRLLARDELTAVFIPDGLHLPPFVLRNFVNAKPIDRVLFATDAMAAAGAGPGRYRLGRIEMDVGVDGVVREPGRPNFAGSALTMDRGLENVRAFLGWDEATALAACAEGAAAAVGLLPAGSAL